MPGNIGRGRVCRDFSRGMRGVGWLFQIITPTWGNYSKWGSHQCGEITQNGIIDRRAINKWQRRTKNQRKWKRKVTINIWKHDTIIDFRSSSCLMGGWEHSTKLYPGNAYTGLNFSFEEFKWWMADLEVLYLKDCFQLFIHVVVQFSFSLNTLSALPASTASAELH